MATASMPAIYGSLSLSPIEGVHVQELPNIICELTKAVTSPFRSRLFPTTCITYRSPSSDLSASEAYITTYCILCVLIPIIGATALSLAGCRPDHGQKPLPTPWIRLMLALLLLGLDMTLLTVQASTIQTYHYCSEKPIYGFYQASWILFGLYSGGFLACLVIVFLNLGSRCWQTLPGYGRRLEKYLLIPAVIIGVAMAPLVLVVCLWIDWPAEDVSDAGPAYEKMAEVELGFGPASAGKSTEFILR